jgi:hypothetical protein
MHDSTQMRFLKVSDPQRQQNRGCQTLGEVEVRLSLVGTEFRFGTVEKSWQRAMGSCLEARLRWASTLLLWEKASPSRNRRSRGFFREPLALLCSPPGGVGASCLCVCVCVCVCVGTNEVLCASLLEHGTQFSDCSGCPNDCPLRVDSCSPAMFSSHCLFQGTLILLQAQTLPSIAKRKLP